MQRNLQRGIFKKTLLMERISCFTNTQTLSLLSSEMNSKVYMKLKQKVKSIWNNLVYRIDPHLIESIASFRSINNVTQRTELCAGTGVLVHGTFAAIYRLGRQTYGGTAAPPRCTGVQAAGERGRCTQSMRDVPTRDRLGSNRETLFPLLLYRTQLYAKLQLYSFQMVLRKLSLPFKYIQTGIESGNPFSWLQLYARLFAVQLHSFQVVQTKYFFFLNLFTHTPETNQDRIGKPFFLCYYYLQGSCIVSRWC